MEPYYEMADGASVIYHGDTLDFTAPIVADVLLTDPPYSRAGSLHTGRRNRAVRHNDARDGDQFWLYWFRSAIKSSLSHINESGCGFIFSDYRTIGLVEDAVASADLGWQVSQCIVWDRECIGMGSPFRASHELIAFVRGPEFRWTGPKDLGNVIRHKWFYGSHEHHPAEKPVGLLRQLIQTVAPTDGIVFDPFLGSGSTLLAARSCGRRAFGVELEEQYCERAAQRLQQAYLPLEVV